MKKLKLFIVAAILLSITASTYFYFRKQPVENVPKRAILVLNQINIIENEVKLKC